MISKEIMRAVSTGKVLFGRKIALRKTADAKALILSEDCPKKEEIIQAANKKPVYVFKGNNIELGTACGKPFGVSVLLIIDEGKSSIMNVITE